jgi:hypothetical protein
VIKKVVTNRARDDTLPVFFHEHISEKNTVKDETLIMRFDEIMNYFAKYKEGIYVCLFFLLKITHPDELIMNRL